MSKFFIVQCVHAILNWTPLVWNMFTFFGGLYSMIPPLHVLFKFYHKHENLKIKNHLNKNYVSRTMVQKELVNYLGQKCFKHDF